MSFSNPMLNLFGRSPIQPLQQHMNTVHDCVASLMDFFKATQKAEWAQAERQQNHIAELEDKADEIKKDLRLHLPKSLFLPVARNDILDILLYQDRIANKAEDISGLIFGRHMHIPDKIEQDYFAFLQRSIDASRQARKAIRELNALFEAGFRGNEVSIIHEMVTKLDEIEDDSDRLQITVRRGLFKIEKELPAIDAIFLYKIIDWTGELADNAETVGGRIHLLLAC